LEVITKAYGTNYYDSTRVSLRIGTALAMMGRFSEAEQMKVQTLRTLEAVPSTVRQPHTRSFGYACTLLIEARQWAEARTLCKRAMDEAEEVFGTLSPWYLHAAAGTAEVELRTDQLADGVARLEQLLQILETSKGNLLVLARTKFLLAQASSTLGAKERAKQLAKDAREIWIQIGVKDERRLVAAAKLSSN
jgi:hypothetical protein